MTKKRIFNEELFVFGFFDHLNMDYVFLQRKLGYPYQISLRKIKIEIIEKK